MVVLVVLALLLSLGEGSSLRNELANSLDANEPVDNDGDADADDGDADDGVAVDKPKGSCGEGNPGVFGKGLGGKCQYVRWFQGSNDGTTRRSDCCPGLVCKRLKKKALVRYRCITAS
jgi:hypothetical protein